MKDFPYFATTAIATAMSLGMSPHAAAADAQGRAAGNASSSGPLAEIVVTAQRREEQIQDVPITITAFSEERLRQQNITSAQGLNGLVPSLTVLPNSQASRDVSGFTLRGIQPTYQGGSSVFQYLAEVPLAQGVTTNQQGAPGNFLDLENVQVLAGPQGTLFGRNSTGGTVLLVPRKPTNDFGGYIQVSAGNYNYVGVEGAANIPLVQDKLLVRVAASYQDRRGFTEDIVWDKWRDDLHYYTGRLSVLFKPTDGLENYLVAFGSRSDTNGTTYVHRGFDVDGIFRPFGICSTACDVMTYQTQLANEIGRRKTRPGIDQFDKTDGWGMVNKTSIELTDQLTLNNIVSYQRFKKHYNLDSDGTPLTIGDIGPNPYPDFPVAGLAEFGIAPNGFFNSAEFGPRDNIKQFTEELQLQANLLDNRWQITVGGFYFNSAPASTQLNRAIFLSCRVEDTGSPSCPAFYQFYSVENRSKAVYGQSTFDFGAVTPALDNLRLTTGFRYSWERVKGSTTYYRINAAGPGFVCINSRATVTDPQDCTFRDTSKFGAPTWTFGLDYKASPDVLLFAKASKGFKGGGFNPFSVREETRTFDPEKVISYEIGFKSDWTIGTVPFRLNVAAYKSDYNSIQRVAPDFNVATRASGSQIVAQSAKIKGVELEATFRPIPALEIGATASHTDGHLVKRVTPVPYFDCRGPIPAGSIVNETCTFGVPRWVYNIHGSLDVPIPENWGKLKLFASYSHVGEQRIDPSEPGGVLAPIKLVNLSANWRNVGQSNFDVEAFVTNATNKFYQIAVAGIYGAAGIWSEVYGEPRMYGVRLRYNFGQ